MKAGDRHLLIFGLGYSARAVAELAVAQGYAVTGTSRRPEVDAPAGVALVHPEAATEPLGRATHWLCSAPPGEHGDPILALLGPAMRAARPCWIGYFSTTGVYGDRGGGWVDERTPPAPTGPRGRRRLEAEGEWTALAATTGARLDLLRIAGIYGPGRSPFDTLRAGDGRRVIAPGHAFGRIHRDDIAGATLAAMRDGPPHRVLNLTDDLPAESATVIAEAARLLNLPLPPEMTLEDALAAMSPMGRSFWAENRKVDGRITQEMLQRRWTHPTFREGLAAILAAGG